MADYRDPYKVLGVSPSSTDDEIKEAYRALARKYHPDKYTDKDMKELAEEKMKEVNAAYEEIQRMRSGSGNKNQGGYSSHGNKFENVRRNLANGNVNAALNELNYVNPADRNAEWYYLMGCVQLKMGAYVEAQRNINLACQMDPSNLEYQSTRDRLNMQAQGYGRGYNTNQNSGCSGCEVCQALLCADCCCECMGGDLIRCC